MWVSPPKIHVLKATPPMGWDWRWGGLGGVQVMRMEVGSLEGHQVLRVEVGVFGR